MVLGSRISYYDGRVELEKPRRLAAALSGQPRNDKQEHDSAGLREANERLQDWVRHDAGDWNVAHDRQVDVLEDFFDNQWPTQLHATNNSERLRAASRQEYGSKAGEQARESK